MKKMTGILTLIVALIIICSSAFASESFEQTAVVTENTEESGTVSEEMIIEDNTDYTEGSSESSTLEKDKWKKHITIGEDEFELKITPSRTDPVEVFRDHSSIKDMFINVHKSDWNDDLGRMKPPARLK